MNCMLYIRLDMFKFISIALLQTHRERTYGYSGGGKRRGER